ncbi:MAG TPA: hypothetical protein VJ911_09110 [Cryomorphaceae bacterium]|nr:hypothetical protein [Cryomorphaceae bacterium]
MKRLLFIVVTFLSPLYLGAQTISGKIYSGAYLKPLYKISVRSGIKSTKTDTQGAFTLELTTGEPLIISDNKHHTQEIAYQRILQQKDHNFYLTPTASSYSQVLQNNDVEIIHNPSFENIFDYTFLSDTLIILSYMNSESKTSAGKDEYTNCALTAMRYGEVFDRQILPDYINRLHVDPFGQLFLEGSESCHIVTRSGKKLVLNTVDSDNFYDQILPMYAVEGDFIFYQYPYAYIPQVSHRIFSRKDRTSYPIRFIRNEGYFDKVEDDLIMLSPREVKLAKDYSKETGINYRLFSTFIRSYYLLRDISHPYAPGFSQGENILIFDHMNDWLFAHDMLGNPIDSVSIYHNSLNREELIQIIQDKSDEKLYTHHDKAGVQYIRKLDAGTGGSGRPYKIYHPFAEMVKIFEGYVYYLHRDPKNTDTRHLIREKLPF